MLKKTTIVCTLGPSSNTPEIIEKMIKAGMNVARFNFSHGSHEEHKQRIDMVRAASKKIRYPRSSAPRHERTGNSVGQIQKRLDHDGSRQ